MRVLESQDISGFVRPFAVHIDFENHLYVCDFNAGSIFKFTPTFELIWEKKGFKKPHSLDTDLRGYLYICDYGEQKISIHRPDGQHYISFKNPRMQGPATAYLADDVLYVTDYGSSTVQKYGAMGDFLGYLGPFEKFDRPHQCRFDEKGNAYVADTWAHRVRIFNKKGEHVKSIPTPTPVALDVTKEFIAVLSFEKARLDFLTFDGSLLWTYENAFNKPYDVKIKDNKAFIADADNRRIHTFSFGI